MKSKKTSIVIDIDGMICAGCVRSVEKTLLDHAFVKNASVNLVTRTAWVDLVNEESSINEVLKVLTDRGFPSKEREENDYGLHNGRSSENQKNLWKYQKQLIIAIALLLLSSLAH